MNQSTVKTPFHLWVVGILSLLWNAFGAFDYTATQYRIESYMGQFPQEQLDYFYSFPSWVEAAWAVGVWGSLLGSIFLLLRKSWALAASTVYNFVLSNGMEMMGEGAAMFTAVIWVIALLLFFYASAMAKRGVLT
jgi:hypothetical protein